LAKRYRTKGASEIREQHSSLRRKFSPRVEQLIASETVGAGVLFLVSMIALLWANSPWSASYFNICQQIISLDLGFISLTKPLRHWINDGLMAIFFFEVGLEIKRELVGGELASPRRAALPVLAACGGMLAPALIFTAFAGDTPWHHGWGIPVATDIAFSLGVYGLVARRLAPELRIFLLAVAVADDIGAVLVIALFYTESFSLSALVASALVFGAVLFLRALGYRPILGYVVVGIIFWLAVLKSGVHATIAGVILGLLTPARPLISKPDFLTRLSGLRDQMAGESEEESERHLGQLEILVRETEAPLSRLERLLQPWNAFFVMPVFALVNAGIKLDMGAVREAVLHPAAQGIFFGLLVGKPVGIVLSSFLGVKLGFCELPRGVDWRSMVSVAFLAGIGFTVSLFVTSLAFVDESIAAIAKVGVFAGSSLAAMIAVALFLADRRRNGNQSADRI
jgi:NhaA family Na+:H+ antiporter